MADTVIRDAIASLCKAITENPAKARVKDAPATASLAGGLKFSSTGPSGQKLETDMPKGLGGTTGAPTPGWALRAALASCTGTAIAMRALTLGIALDRLDVTVESESDARGLLGLDDSISPGMLGLRMRVAIRAQNASPDVLKELVHWGDVHSPVACTLRAALAPDIEVVVEPAGRMSEA
jgi:uncharacterized OsmC-like protein